MDGNCNQQVEKSKKLWKEAKQACAEVEQWLGRLQRTTTPGQAQAVTEELSKAQREANEKVKEANTALQSTEDYCYGL